MSKYTTEVRYLCETRAGYDESQGYMSINDILKKSAPKIFDFDFPIFDEAYRLPLEIKILKHYYTREICAETFGRWKLFLDQTMNEIMPLYNEKYRLKAEAMKNFANGKLWNDIDLQTTRKTDDKGNTKSTGTVNSTSNSTDRRDFTENRNNSGTRKDAYSETPQGSLHGVDTLSYLTNYRKVDDTGNENLTHGETVNSNASNRDESASNTDITNTQDYVEHILGKRGGKDYMNMYKDAYDSLVNIDMEIIREINDLFFALW